MKLSDIDFSSLGRMFDAMSDEEKEKLNNMAEGVINNLKDQAAPQENEEEELSVYEKLKIDEEEYSFLSGESLDQIEAALDLEEYYEDYPEADLSASILFYQKALLSILRKYMSPVFVQADLGSVYERPAMLNFYAFIQPLASKENQEKLIAAGYGSQELIEWMYSRFMQVYTLLNQAEYAFPKTAENERMKEILFKENLLKTIFDFQNKN
jgi:hypothetical protein